jgi:NHL repeat-containing protein
MGSTRVVRLAVAAAAGLALAAAGLAWTAGAAVAGGGASLGDGGPAAMALLSSPSAVAVSPAGSLLVTDRGDNRLRAISP